MFHEKESQFELFPGSTNYPESSSPTRFMSRRFVISLEGLFVVSMLVAIGMVVAFSLGVERGKLMVRTIRSNPAPVPKIPLSQFVPSVASPAPINPQAAPLNINPVLAKPQAAVLANTNVPKPQEAVKTIVPAMEDNLAKPDDKKKIIDKGYTIQVASFKNHEYAEKEAIELKKNGFDPSVSSKGNHVIVCVGKFVTKKEAEQFSRKLKSKYKDPVIRSF